MSKRTAKQAHKTESVSLVQAKCRPESVTAERSNGGGVAAANSARISPTEHLRPYQFKPGQSGNPSGRPKGIVAKALRKELQRKIPGSDETLLKAYVRKYVEEAIKECDAARFNSIRDTLDGRPSANDSEGGNIGTVNIVYAGERPAWLPQPSPQLPQANQPNGEPQDATPAQRKSDSGS